MVQLFGRITKDAIVREVKEGKKVVNFSIALNDSYKPKNGEIRKFVTYVNCAYWLSTASAEFITKGKIIEVNGRLDVNAYTNMKGDAVGSLNFHVSNFKLFGKSSQEEQTPQPAEKTKGKRNGKTNAEIATPVDDLPF